MRKFQKFSVPVLIGIFLLIFAACGGNGDDNEAATDSGSSTGATTAIKSTGTTGESFEFQYVCVNRTLLPCQVVQEFLDAVRDRTDGQVDIQLSSYPELGISGFDMIRLLEDGTIGFGEIYSGFVGGEIVGFNYYSSNYFFTKGPLNTLADFKGVKTRTHSNVLSDLIGENGGLGANPQTMAFADVYPALERGVLDGAVTCGSCAVGQKWFEVTDYLTGPLPGTFAQTFVTFNGKEWNSLPADFQKIILEEGVKHSERAKAAALNADVEAEGQLIDLGMEHSNFTPDMMSIIKEAAQKSVIPKWAERAGGYESEPVRLYNEKVGPITGLYVQSDGTVE